MNVFNELSPGAVPKPASRAAQKQATRAAVIAAAREEFEAVGYDAANIRAIARRAGVSAGTVIHHGADKRDLLHAALFDDLEATLGEVLADLGHGGLAARLARLTRGVFRYYEKRPRLSRTLLRESLFADPPWAARFNAQVGRVHAEIARLADEAVRRGELRTGCDGARVALAYFAFFYFALIAWVQGAHGDPVGMVDRLVEQHLAGLRPASSPRGSKGPRGPSGPRGRNGSHPPDDRNDRNDRKGKKRKP